MKSRRRFGTFWNFWAHAAILRKVGGVSRERERSARLGAFSLLGRHFGQEVSSQKLFSLSVRVEWYAIWWCIAKFEQNFDQAHTSRTDIWRIIQAKFLMKLFYYYVEMNFLQKWDCLFSVTVRKIFHGGLAKSKKIEKLDFRYFVFKISRNVPDKSCSARWDEQSDINSILEISRFEVSKMTPQKWSRADNSGLRYFRETKVAPWWPACPIVIESMIKTGGQKVILEGVHSSQRASLILRSTRCDTTPTMLM